MKPFVHGGLALLLAGVLSGVSSASVEGKPLPAAELEDFTQTEAKSMDDFVGRTVLIEFFAYW